MEREKPILMNGEMVRAVLSGKKTETRRLAKISSEAVVRIGDGFWTAGLREDGEPFLLRHTREVQQAYVPGDVLYVRETWRVNAAEGPYIVFQYGADKSIGKAVISPENGRYARYAAMAGEERWRPSIHMPKEAARLYLTVTDVSLTRLHGMTEADAAREGAESLADFARIWDGTVKDSEGGGWDADPWVFTYRFRTLRTEGET